MSYDISNATVSDFPHRSQPAVEGSFRPSFPRAASATHLPLDKQFRAAAVAAANAANAAAAQEPVLSSAADDEVSQIILGQENQPNIPPVAPASKVPEKVDFGLPERGAFSDPHDGQRQEMHMDRKASISTQLDFAAPDVLHQSGSSGNICSFVPTSSETSAFKSTTNDTQSS